MATKKKLLVTPDTTSEEMLNLDKVGGTLTWDTANFVEVPAETLQMLSKANRDRYTVFKELAEEAALRDEVDEMVASTLNVDNIAARASDRLRVVTTKKGVVTRWERPDMLEVRKSQGWKLAKTGHRTLSGDGTKGDGIHRIGSKGQEELVLIEIDERAHRKLGQAKKQRRQRALTGINNEAKSQLRRLGSEAAGESLDILEGDSDENGVVTKAISHEGGN